MTSKLRKKADKDVDVEAIDKINEEEFQHAEEEAHVKEESQQKLEDSEGTVHRPQLQGQNKNDQKFEHPGTNNQSRVIESED